MRSLLAVFGHPDDETFGSGGLLARYAAEGVTVSLICATRGDVGEISDPSLATPENLAEVREQELRAACAVLGIEEPTVFGYRDSGMAGTPDNEHPRAFCRADYEEVLGRVVEVVRQRQPQVLVTFDPGGAYGHPDHILAHQLAKEAFAAAGDPARFAGQLSEGLAPHRPQKLYYVVFPLSTARAFVQAMKEANVDSDFTSMDPDAMGVPDDQVTTVLDVGPYAEVKQRAALCHRTQIQGGQLFPWVPPELMRQFLAAEHLIRAQPPFQPDGEPLESDLFSGIAA